MKRAGFGSFPTPRYDWTCSKEKCQLVQNEVYTQSEEETLQQNGQHVQARGVEQVEADGTLQTSLGFSLNTSSSLTAVVMVC